MTPNKFQHAGLDWIPHIPGDPMPCPGNKVVRVLLREEEDGRRYCDEQQRASTYDWVEFGAPSIIGWHPIEEQTSLARRVLDLLEAGDTEQAKHELRKELE